MSEDSSDKYPWNKTQKAIFWKTVEDIPAEAGLEFIHRKIHRLMDVDVPINRLELLELCEDEAFHSTKQDWQRHITDYKRVAVKAGILEVIDPKDFISENPIENMGLNFSPRGGYSLFDEGLKEIINFKTNDKALQYVMEQPDWAERIKIQQTKLKGGGIFTPDAPRDINVSLKEIRQKGVRTFTKRTDAVNHVLERDAEAMLDNIDTD